MRNARKKIRPPGYPKRKNIFFSIEWFCDLMSNSVLFTAQYSFLGERFQLYVLVSSSLKSRLSSVTEPNVSLSVTACARYLFSDKFLYVLSFV